MEQTIINKTEYPDSIEISTAGKGGCLKIYFNALKPDEARIKADNALALRAHMNAEINKGTQ